MKRIVILTVVLFATASIRAQQPPPAGPPPDDDPIARQLFPPELIMAQAQKIRLDERQKVLIKSEVQRVQSKFFDLQWDTREASESMAQLLQQTPIDETKVLQQADKVMGLEREIKKLHLSMLIRIKNALTAEQIQQLKQLRPAPGYVR